MRLEDKIGTIIAPALTAMGYDIVQIRMMDGKDSATLQIMAERLDQKEMTVDDCADISRTVSALIDVEDPISSAYRLEISSPGIDRPLVKPEDYVRFMGYEAKIETSLPMNGRKRFKGKMTASDAKSVTMESGGDVFTIPFSSINFAKLVLTDELIREHLRKSKKAQEKKKASN